jgi:hypothetical protein
VAQKQMANIHGELHYDKPYQGLGDNFFDRLNQKALEQSLVERLQGLGYRLQLHPQNVAAAP